MIKLKRAYEESQPDDGIRILVERLWPRGLTKERAQIDQWVKELAPSPALRKWYGHDVAKWPAFQQRYRAELDQNAEAVAALLRLARNKTVTFVFAAKDEQHNSAVVLKEYIESV